MLKFICILVSKKPSNDSLDKKKIDKVSLLESKVVITQEVLTSSFI